MKRGTYNYKIIDEPNDIGIIKMLNWDEFELIRDILEELGKASIRLERFIECEGCTDLEIDGKYYEAVEV